MLTRIRQHISATTTYPNSTVADDYDVYCTIAHTVKHMQPLVPAFRHVKGHQDTNPRRRRPPTLPEQLNIDCDGRAAELLPHARRLQLQHHPQLPLSLPHVIIQGKTIVRNLPKSLRHAATTPDYREYLQRKYNLNNTAIDDINWLTIKLSIRRLNATDRTRIQKFLHDWLPLKGASHMASPSASNLCPHCQREPETTWHFFECQHPSRTARFLQLQAAITSLHVRNHVDPHLTQLYWQGLQTIRQDAPIDEQLASYPLPYQQLFIAQRAIGWDQLYYGRISVQWARQLTRDSHYTTDGNLFYATATDLVWRYLLDCWSLRNQALHHPPHVPTDALVLAEQARHIIETARANPEIAHLAPQQPIETILQQPIPRLRRWVQTGKSHLNNCLSAAHQRAILHTRDIRNFFSPKQANDLRPP